MILITSENILIIMGLSLFEAVNYNLERQKAQVVILVLNTEFGTLSKCKLRITNIKRNSHKPEVCLVELSEVPRDR